MKAMVCIVRRRSKSGGGRTQQVATLLLGALFLSSSAAAQSPALSTDPSEGHWRQWGGPSRNFVVHTPALAETWPEGGPPVRWSRPLGTGHSAILFDGNRLYTMYRAGNARAKQGPWADEEAVLALDASTGKTLWEHKYPSRREDFSFGAGPHSTPLIVGSRLFTIGTNQQLFAFDKLTGRVLWSHDFIKEFRSPELLIRPVVKTGYGCSPIAVADTIVCSVGGPGQSVMAFRQSDGAVVWKSGDFLTSPAPPILIDFGGRAQLVFLAGGTITGLDATTGAILWSHPHDPGNDLNCSTPLWGTDDILFVSSAYKAGSRAIQLRATARGVETSELWFTNRVRFMFLSAVRLGDFVYGTTGDFGPAFLTALNIKTGQTAWQHRGFGRASLVAADGKVIVLDEDGDLALTRLTPEGATVLAQAKVFDTTSWTMPTLVGTMLYARDREKIVALDLGAAATAGMTAPMPPAGRGKDAGAAATPQVVSQAQTTPSDTRALSSAPAFAGTWALDASASRLDPAAGLAGLIGAGAPVQLYITQPANGAVLLESPVNEGHVRVYQPGAKTQTPIGQGGTITMTAQLNGRTLSSEGTAVNASGASVAMKEELTLSADETTLSVTVTASATDVKSSVLLYRRTADQGPCESWSTPCKRTP